MKKENLYDYSEYADVGHNHPDDLHELTKLAEAQRAAEASVEKLEEELKSAKEVLKNIAEKQLPQKMEEVGLTTFETSSGISVEISEKIRASLAPENRPKAYAWLEENGFGGMIKSNVVVNFGRNEITEAATLVEQLRLSNRLANLERKVEPMTLTAFVSEQLTQGKDIPLDIFGVFRQRIAKIEV